MSGLTSDPRGRKVVARRRYDTKPDPPRICSTCGKPLPAYVFNAHACKEPAVTAELDAFLGLDEPPRDQWKRPLIVPAEGGKPTPYTRVSTFAGALDDAGGLVVWKGRMAARGIAQREDLAAMVAGLTYSEDPDENRRKREDRRVNKLLDEYIETAITSVDDKAAWGTAVHSFTEPQPSPFVPERMRADVDSYHQALADHSLECVAAEQFVANDALKVAGTFDGIYEHPRLGRMLGDKKTGKVKAHSVAVQLAAYAGGDLYGWDPVTRTPLGVRQDIGLLFHIPKGGGKTEIHLVDLEAGRAAAKAALWVRSWRDRDDLLTHFNALTVADLKAAS